MDDMQADMLSGSVSRALHDVVTARGTTEARRPVGCRGVVGRCANSDWQVRTQPHELAAAGCLAASGTQRRGAVRRQRGHGPLAGMQRGPGHRHGRKSLRRDCLAKRPVGSAHCVGSAFRPYLAQLSGGRPGIRRCGRDERSATGQCRESRRRAERSLWRGSRSSGGSSGSSGGVVPGGCPQPRSPLPLRCDAGCGDEGAGVDAPVRG